MESSYIYNFYTKKFSALFDTFLGIILLLFSLHSLYIGVFYEKIDDDRIPDLVIKRKHHIDNYIHSPFVFPNSLLGLLKFELLILVLGVFGLYQGLNNLFLRKPKFIINNQGIKEHSYNIFLWSDIESIEKIRRVRSSRYYYQIKSKVCDHQIIIDPYDLYMKITTDKKSNYKQIFPHEISEIIKSCL